MRIAPALLIPFLLAALLLMAGSGPASHRSAAAASPSSSPEPFTRTELAAVDSAIARGYRLELARTVIPPSGWIPAHRQPGDQVLYVESGMLNIDILPDPMAVPDPDGEPTGTSILVAGESIALGEDTLQVWSNRAEVPVVALTASLFDGFAEPTVLMTPAPDPSPRVVRRIVVEGGRDDGYRMTILDRSGHVLGARLPRPAELRFAVGGMGVQMDDGTAADGRLALLRWSGTACGPVVDIDVAADLSRIHIADRSPGCDASAQGHALVLRLDDSESDLSRAHVTWQRVRE